ncbi:MAG TPA: helix-turn-helix domain-containing protein, partial [Thermoanaerobaculia bacterium]|nr:helix-turn-helix domain-containing protein [Thermoanaerobaculia bacterium]
AWEELLAVVRIRQLSESELIQARQFLVRNWSVPSGVLVLPRMEPEAPNLRPAPPEPPLPPADRDPEPGSFQDAREEYDRRLVAAALDRTGRNISQASRLLRMSRNTLKAKMRRYGL